jgi:hypothetical protein
MEPDTSVVYDDVKEKQIAENTSDESREHDVYDTVPFPFGLIKGTYSLPSEIQEYASSQQKKAKCPKRPLVLSVKDISERRCYRHGTHSQKHQDDR